jgi:hypothetical protein
VTEPQDTYRISEEVKEINGINRDILDADCARFQASMPERIGAGEELQSDPHMLTCERCSALVRELEYIADVARQLMPIEEEPRDELWTSIQLAIERGDA